MNNLPGKIQTASDWIREARRIVVFTGAGISAESGIATFRDAGGFWQRFPPEQFATWEGLLELSASNPNLLAEFLLELLEPIARAVPNAGHKALVNLQRHRQVTVITQNVDGLHQEAGSTYVKEVHGTLFEVVTEDRQPLGKLSRPRLLNVVLALQSALAGGFREASLKDTLQPLMGFGPEGFYRPNLVLFGDGLKEPDWTESLAVARSCDLLLTVGTSGLVLPAAMLPHEAQSQGARIIGIDPAEESGQLWLNGSASQLLPAIIEAAFPA